jgi:hypothetical protein
MKTKGGGGGEMDIKIHVSLTLVLDGVSDQLHAPASLTLVKERLVPTR